MDPIITVTFHPCIDVNVSVPALVPDVKLACTQVQRQPGGGALLATRNGCRRFPAPEVVVASTVGAGDSMVAGILLSLDSGMPLERAVAFGVICGAAATLHAGTGLCRPEDVNRLKHQIEAHEKNPVY
jgi:fructose-1-phosphate kinase PfkB-like protein